MKVKFKIDPEAKLFFGVFDASVLGCTKLRDGTWSAKNSVLLNMEFTGFYNQKDKIITNCHFADEWADSLFKVLGLKFKGTGPDGHDYMPNAFYLQETIDMKEL